ncbi:hypothetical protein [Glutamicibacter arilaitensis]|uniref:hypothetical protein n=1 Tax=Glutamicibacter arilaitensis TaxID=256701 RepID=UPI003F98910D
MHSSLTAVYDNSTSTSGMAEVWVQSPGLEHEARRLAIEALSEHFNLGSSDVGDPQNARVRRAWWMFDIPFNKDAATFAAIDPGMPGHDEAPVDMLTYSDDDYESPEVVEHLSDASSSP